MADFLLPEGRIVKGHPMIERGKTDQNNQPVLDKTTGVQVKERYFAFAVPKQGETDWRQTSWGAQIVAAASDPVHGYTSAEQQTPRFSWKIDDGDSAVPNLKGNAPKDQEGYPGHWVIHFTSAIFFNSYSSDDNFTVPLSDSGFIKTGDYGKVYMSSRGNKPSQTPGVYLNPRMFGLTRKGEQIVSDNLPSAASVFGDGQSTASPLAGATTPPPAAPAPNTPPPAPAAPATPPPVPVEEKYDVQGTVYTRSQLLAMPGWTEAHLTNLPKVG